MTVRVTPTTATAETPIGTNLRGVNLPVLGLVCITVGPEVRYRTVTRTRFRSLSEADKTATLDRIYRENIQTLFGAVDYCHTRGIRLYRATSNLFPQVDDPAAPPVLATLRPVMATFGAYAASKGVRVVLHPDQFVVLNSISEAVQAQSVEIMQSHAQAFDWLGLPQTPWTAFILHGGKGGRSDELVEAISRLPDTIRNRLVLENDESTYSAEEILSICRRAKVPMVFDAHHHAVHEKLENYEHESIRRYTELARETWPNPEWQMVHISNGSASFADPRHSDLITTFPSAFLDVPWVEVEAKKKEEAIDHLCRQLATAAPR